MNDSRNIARMIEPSKYVIGKNTFYIYPMPAFTAANVSGEVISLLTPLLASVASAIGGKKEEKNLMDMDMSEAAPLIAGAFSSLSGDKVEGLLRKLLSDGQIGVLQEGKNEALWLTEDVSNEVFCGNAQDMFILAFYVIRENYKDFFGSFGNLFGRVEEAARKMGFPGMEPLT